MNRLQRQGWHTLYVDIMPTASFQDFVNELAKAVIGKLDSKPAGIIKKAIQLFSSLRPVISVDALTGQPEVSITLDDEKHSSQTLDKIFGYLASQSKQKKIVIAIDEFQQITTYPEKNTEANLRSRIQHLQKIHFIFSGSSRHLLSSMFSEHKRPFYQSAQMLYIDRINPDSYKSFIHKKFAAGKRKINDAEIDFILEWTRHHTWYSQYVCNKLYSTGEKKITRELVNHTLYRILLELEPNFYNYRNLLTLQQWNLLEALAKEKETTEILSQKFIGKHKLTATSTVKSALKVLIDREMILHENKSYLVYDVFLSRWMERL